MKIKAVNQAIIAAFFYLSAGAAQPVSAADVRNEPIDAYILIDKSSSMKNAVADAAEWICHSVIDDLLINGDRVTVWTFSDGAQSLVEDSTLAEGSKEDLKKKILDIASDDKAPDISEALKSLLGKAERRDSPRQIAYVLVASSLIETASDEADKLLKHSRVEERPGWKALVVGVGIEKRVAEQTQEYLRAAGTP